MEHGDHEVEVLRQCYKRGDDPPESFQNAPELRQDLQPFWNAYEELATCRSYAGMSGVPLPIPWTAIDQYAVRYKFTGEMYEDLVDIIRQVDRAFLERAIEKAEEEHDQSE